LLLSLAIAFSAHLHAQNWPLKQAVTNIKNAGKTFTPLSAFTLDGSKRTMQNGTWQPLHLSSTFINKVMADQPEAIQIVIPVSANKTIDCELVKVNPCITNFTENNKTFISQVIVPVMYQGVVKGKKEKNNVIFTVNNNYVSLLATHGDTTYQISKIENEGPAAYRLYNSTEVLFPSYRLNCGTIDNAPPQTARNLSAARLPGQTTSATDKCILVYVDCFDSLYRWRNSNFQSTVNYVYDLFNLVIAGYKNDSLNLQVQTVNVWTTTDPYRTPNRETALTDLAFYRKDDFYGNICLGLDYSSLGRFGLASKIGKVKAVLPNSCAAFKESDSTGAFAYCDQNYGGNYQNFPTGPSITEAQVYQVMHEIGHLLGAHHTHWCGWLLSQNPDVYGAIDNCAPVEPVSAGSLCNPGTAPVNGGTIMSYCNTAPAFVDYRNGFGTIPANTIKSFVASTPCIPDCYTCPPY
jgi:hypothetical protein